MARLPLAIGLCMACSCSSASVDQDHSRHDPVVAQHNTRESSSVHQSDAASIASSARRRWLLGAVSILRRPWKSEVASAGVEEAWASVESAVLSSELGLARRKSDLALLRFGRDQARAPGGRDLACLAFLTVDLLESLGDGPDAAEALELAALELARLLYRPDSQEWIASLLCCEPAEASIRSRLDAGVRVLLGPCDLSAPPALGD